MHLIIAGWLANSFEPDQILQNTDTEQMPGWDFAHARDESESAHFANVHLHLIILLYGSDALSDQQNSAIFKSVQKFIIRNKRFSSAN